MLILAYVPAYQPGPLCMVCTAERRSLVVELDQIVSRLTDAGVDAVHLILAVHEPGYAICCCLISVWGWAKARRSQPWGSAKVSEGRVRGQLSAVSGCRARTRR